MTDGPTASRLTGTWPGRVLLAAGAAGDAFWASGSRSFSLSADLAVALPVATALSLVFVAAAPTHLADTRRGLSWQPLALLLTIAAALELAALALGGHSRPVPSFSTVVDQALAWRASRFALFLLWLSLGLWPAVRRLRASRTGMPA